MSVEHGGSLLSAGSGCGLSRCCEAAAAPVVRWHQQHPGTVWIILSKSLQPLSEVTRLTGSCSGARVRIYCSCF